MARNLSLEVAYQMYHGVHIQTPYDGNYKENGKIDPFVGPFYTAVDPNLVQREFTLPPETRFITALLHP